MIRGALLTIFFLVFAVEARGQHRPLVFVAIPLENPTFMYRELLPFLDTLSARTGLQFQLKIYNNYRETLRHIQQGDVDLAYLSGTTFLEANRLAGFHVLVEAQHSHNPYYQSVIITRTSSGLDSIAQLAGKRFAFGSPYSTSNALVPAYLLLKHGLRLADLGDYQFLKHHNHVVLGVLNGRYHAGGVRKAIADQYKQYGLKYLAVSDSIPHFSITYNPQLADSVLQLIRQALLSMQCHNAYFDSFIPADDSVYDPIRRMVQYLKQNNNFLY